MALPPIVAHPAPAVRGRLERFPLMYHGESRPVSKSTCRHSRNPSRHPHNPYLRTLDVTPATHHPVPTTPVNYAISAPWSSLPQPITPSPQPISPHPGRHSRNPSRHPHNPYLRTLAVTPATHHPIPTTHISAPWPSLPQPITSFPRPITSFPRPTTSFPRRQESGDLHPTPIHRHNLRPTTQTQPRTAAATITYSRISRLPSIIDQHRVVLADTQPWP